MSRIVRGVTEMRLIVIPDILFAVRYGQPRHIRFQQSWQILL